MSSEMKDKLKRREAQQSSTAPQSTFPREPESRLSTRTKQSEPTKRTSIDLPESLHRRLRMAAVEHDTYQVNIIVDALEKWLEEH